ncbi:MAG: cytochrome c3 family protein [bacterium]
MSSKLRRYMVLPALAGLSVAVIMAVVTLSVPEEGSRASSKEIFPVNYISLHDSSSPDYNPNCISCHGKMTSETTLDPQIESAHTLHLTSKLLNFGCTTCHQNVDLTEKSAASLRKQVDTELCTTCHSPFSTKEMDQTFAKMDCTLSACHGDWKEKMKEVKLAKLDEITKENCLLCHGGQTWYPSR